MLQNINFKCRHVKVCDTMNSESEALVAIRNRDFRNIFLMLRQCTM